MYFEFLFGLLHFCTTCLYLYGYIQLNLSNLDTLYSVLVLMKSPVFKDCQKGVSNSQMLLRCPYFRVL